MPGILAIDSNLADLNAEIMRRTFAAKTPALGSCNGMQRAASVLGGASQETRNGREDGLARNIRITPEGQSHPMLAGRQSGYAVPCTHRDEVTQLRDGAV